MDTRKIAAEYRLSQWMNVIREQQNSGQSIKEFCQDRGISRNSYFYWRRKLREAACMELSKIESGNVDIPKGWVKLSQSQEVQSALDIEVSGCRITVNENTDLELLKRVCRILRVL
jgi:putative transposase